MSCIPHSGVVAWQNGAEKANKDACIDELYLSMIGELPPLQWLLTFRAVMEAGSFVGAEGQQPLQGWQFADH